MKLEQARELANKNQTKDALAAYDNLKAEYAKNADFWLEYALVAMGGSYNVVAEKCVQESAKINPKSHAAIYVWGMIKKKAGEFTQAERFLSEAYKISPSFHYGIQLANAYVSNKKHKEGLDFLEKLESLASNDNDKSMWLLAKGSALLALGKSAEAIVLYENELKLGTRNFRIFREFALAKKISEQDVPVIKQYEALAANVSDKDEWADDLFLGLGKAYEDLSDYKKAAEYYAKGKEILSKKQAYDGNILAGMIGQSTKILTPEMIKSKQVKNPIKEITPIFIVGMPRSGTTLLEQVLATDKKVHACGELPTILQIAGRSSLKVADKGYLIYPNNIPALTQDFFNAASDNYINNLVNIKKKSRVFVDKMPANVNYLGLINIILPHAKIIHLKRDLRDVALSIFCHSFRDAGMQYSNRFEDIIFFIEQYLIILAHWKKVIPSSFIEVKYSDLVENFDQTTKRVFEYCGLERPENAQDFYKNAEGINTASRSQVKQPLYKSSLEKWRNYEPYYGKYFEEIAALASKYGY